MGQSVQVQWKGYLEANSKYVHNYSATRVNKETREVEQFQTEHEIFRRRDRETFKQVKTLEKQRH